MSLIKQLWIAIAVVMSLSLGGSLVVSTLSARHYLEQQLQVKNLDNATSLALSLSQMPKDPVTVELQVAAQFDAGHYRLIRLTDPSGEVLVEREYQAPLPGAPEWFVNLIPIDARPGVSQVQDGWRQFATLTLESHKRYAYEALWDGTLQLLAWFLLGGALTGLVGTLIVKHITRPLGSVVEQAEAIGGRRFVTTDEPSTTEFRSVVRAMNALSGRVRTMLQEESQRLEQLRRQSQHDELTGLINRAQFLNVLDAALTREDEHASGTLLIARLADLAELNRRMGRGATDRLLSEIAAPLKAVAGGHPDWEAARINATDFALLAPGADDAQALIAELAPLLHAKLDELAGGGELRLPIATSGYEAGEARAQLLARIDGALAAAEHAGERATRVADRVPPPYEDLPAWRRALGEALAGQGVRLGSYPVLASDGRHLHDEAPMRLMLKGQWQNAGYFMPWAARLGMIAACDTEVVRVALRRIAESGTPLGINLSSESICDAGFRGELLGLLAANSEAAEQLWIELPEYGALRHLAEFRAFCATLRPFGCKVGIEHAGPRFSRLSDLHELGLDYIKIDAAIVRGIHENPGNQAFLRGLCLIAHSLGLLAIAEGVSGADEAAALRELGIDGITGPGVRRAA